MPYAPKQVTCENCKKMFTLMDPRPSRLAQVQFCSTTCRAEHEWVGRKFGVLTVTGLVDNPRNVSVGCDCGKEWEVSRCSLTTGARKHCDCSEKAKRPPEWEGKIDVRGKADCWEYTGARNERGYGVAKIGLVHRAVYARDVGPIPAGMFVLHHCDNPPCCNPTHLWLGTHDDNMKDMAQKGRSGSFWDTATEAQKAAKRKQIAAIGRKPKSPETRAKMSATYWKRNDKT